MGVLIDTCVWVEVERGRLSAADVAAFTGKEPVFISPVTIAELQFGVETAARPEIRQVRSSALARLKRKPLLRIDGDTGIIAGQLNVSLQKMGRSADHRIHDVWLAAQAIQHSFGFLTLNRKDFKDIPGLRLIGWE